MKWMRLRFEANEADYRPIKWPPPGPYWCSGYLCGAVGAAIVIAFIPLDDSTLAKDLCSTAEKIVMEFWPEAKNLGLHGVETSGEQWRDEIKISAMVYKGSKPLLLAEIAKCDLVCANCHRIRTATREEDKYNGQRESRAS